MSYNHDNHTHESDGSKYVNLHNHDEYSILDGVQKVKDYPAFAKNQLGQVAVAQTNHGNVAGAWNFYNSCRSTGIKPLIGMEAYYTLGDHRLKERDELGKPYYHLVLLAQNNQGLHNLFKLSTYAYTEGVYYKPRISDELLAQYGANILATSACLGSAVSQHILKGNYKAAERILDHHARIFQDRFFVEIQPHSGPEQKVVNEILISLANKKNLPLVITADAHYTHSQDKHFHETTLKMATESSDDNAFSFGDIEVHLSGYSEMVERCRRMGLPMEAITNTRAVADMVDDQSYFSDRMNRYPRFKSLPDGITAWEYLEATARGGLIKRVGFPFPPGYEERLKEELSVLKKVDMSDYMLIVAEYINKAIELDIEVGPGRGSAAGSLVAYSLGITQMDPIKYDLLFSRFLNEGRAGTPLFW